MTELVSQNLTLRERWRSYYEKNTVKISAAVFLAGFLADVLTLSAPDSTFAIAQQIIYLGIIIFLLVHESRQNWLQLEPPRLLRRLWPYHPLLLHFFFGSLLSLYSLYFLKSSSLSASLAFMLFMFGLLILNEFPQFQRYGLRARWALLSVCLFSFFLTLYPIAWGMLGLSTFIAAVVTTALVLLVLLKQASKSSLKAVAKQRLVTALAPLVLFIAFYIFKILPPVPLALLEAGVYHDIQKDELNDQYLLYRERPAWKFWQNGDAEFKARPGSRVHLFAAIYSPTTLTETIHMNWQRKSDMDGHWTSYQKIPMLVRGGRENGYRGYTVKSNYDPGKWRVLIETSDGREIGRVHFSITPTLEPITLNIKRY